MDWQTFITPVIIAVVPGHFSLCVWSPALNAAGNSLVGLAALEKLSERIGWSVFSALRCPVSV